MHKKTKAEVMGYVPRASGKHTFIFSTGFLVQEDKDPTKCGWYGFKHDHQVDGNIGGAHLIGMSTTINLPNDMALIFDTVRKSGDQRREENEEGLFREPTDATARLVIFDTPDDDHYVPNAGVRVYVFPDRFVPVDDPKVRKVFDGGTAFAAAGNFNDEGEPTARANLAVRAGLVQFN